jgi:hypothetical protein
MVKRMGDFMLESGAMKEPQVEEVVRLQKAGDTRRFGEIAVALGYITDAAVKRYAAHAEAEGET